MRCTTTRPCAGWLGLLVSMSLVGCVGTPAQARSSRLWSERSAGSEALTTLPDFRSLANALIPSVVSIQVEQRVKTSRAGPMRDDPFNFFHRYFGGEIPREFHNRGLGTGFVIAAEGLILTNNHVVEGADSIEVSFENDDGPPKKMKAKVLGTAPDYDVALLQTEQNANATVAFLGDSQSTHIGDWVMAIGNPFGLSHSVSVGIISAKERRDIAPSGRRGLYDFIQTDASINPGNSGGPLVNLRGEVIGINTAINAAGSGIGFAIPINMVKAMLPDLKTKGRYTKSWIGIKIQPLNPELAESFGLKTPQGALVAQVVAGSPADDAELREGDVVLEFDGKPVRDSADLPLYASMAGVGTEITLKLWREGRTKRVKVRLREFPQDEIALSQGASRQQPGELGMTVADITPDLQRELSLEQARGVVIKEVARGGVAQRAGLQPADVVVSLNGERVKTARQFAEAVRGIKSGDYLRMKVSRKGSRLFLGFRKP